MSIVLTKNSYIYLTCLINSLSISVSAEEFFRDSVDGDSACDTYEDSRDGSRDGEDDEVVAELSRAEQEHYTCAPIDSVKICVDNLNKIFN